MKMVEKMVAMLAGKLEILPAEMSAYEWVVWWAGKMAAEWVDGLVS